MKQNDKKQEYINKLRLKADQLGRLPKKSDFEEFEVVQIKSLFGPWPRALEASGLIAEKSFRKRLKRGSDE
ncbi:MAG: hypothetical protein IJU39_07370 [Clostridia bacterium]|nr:hypothetical protein [Clostridia bacterium]